MTVFIFTNNADGSLASGIGTADVSLSLESGEGADYPSPGTGEGFHVCVVEGAKSEWMICTSRPSDTLTVTRDPVSPQAFSAGATVEHRLHADALNQFLQKGAERTVAADPNGSAAVYSGEEVFDSVNGIWYKHTTGTAWEAMNTS